jgi:hypothetical protein
MRKNEALLEQKLGLLQCCGSGSGSAWIRVDFGRLDPNTDPGGQKRHTKKETEKNFHD